MKPTHGALITVFFVVTTSTSSLAQPTAPTSEDVQAVVDSIRALQYAIVWDDERSVAGEGFDPNTYFDVFQHIQMEPGYVLDWVYQMDGLGGFPILYARVEGVERFHDLASYESAAEGSPGADELSYRNHLVLDGSDTSYIELAILLTIGGQFNLFWHANYNDTSFDLTPERLESVIAGDYRLANQPLPDDVASQAREIELAPIVERGENQVSVGLVTFSNWGGFSRSTLTSPTSGVQTAITQSTEPLVPYSCGIMF